MFAYLLFSPASILGQKDAISMETDRQPDPSAPHSTGKSLSEALIFASTNPQHDYRLFTVHKNCKLRISAEHVVYQICSECQNKTKTTGILSLWFS